MSRLFFDRYPNPFPLSMIKTHLGFLGKDFLGEFMHRTMLKLANYFWILACKCFLRLFGFIFTYIFRLIPADSSQTKDSDFKADHFQQDNEIASISESEEENHEFVFGFRFQTSETEQSVLQRNSLNQDTSKHQTISTEDFRGFVEETETVTFSVQESFVGPNDAPIADNGYKNSGKFNFNPNDSDFQEKSPNQSASKYQFISTKDFRGFIEEPESTSLSIQELCLGSTDSPIVNNENQDSEKFNSKAEEFVETQCSENTVGKGEISSPDYFSHEVGLKSQNPFWCFDLERMSSISTKGVDSVTSDFYADYSFNEKSYYSNLEFIEKNPNLEELNFDASRIPDTDDGFIELEPNFHCSDRSEQESFQRIEKKWKSEEPIGHGKSWDSDFEDDDDEFDILLEHQESIEQKKVEMKNAKSKGMLPTILEESETPKIVEDLKPLRIDEKFGHKYRLEEIQKVYKGYAEKMRKLDVLNCQTLHAISFLQLKYQIHQGSTQKSSVSTIKSLLFPNSWKIKLRKIYADPMLKSITDLHQNLELVYVGQTCLSWEILHWQYGKAKELLEDDFEGYCSYNQVAGEFQQFQVLVQRFVENEPFKGPRVQNYTKNRCDIRFLLHVPAVKDDYLKDKKDFGVEEDYAVSAAMLAQMIEESMRVFWEFLHADKDEANVVLKGIQSTIVDLQDPSDSELLLDIKTSLQKKEKRLKDILRSGNCITKKFQKHQASRVEGKLLFAQVELKLISRVLNMSRLTTEQLVWCQKKLNKIDFLKRKLRVEPSFLLFPLWRLEN